MEANGETSNWIPTSFSGTSEAGDSLSSYQSATTPGSSVAVDQQSADDLSFDAISRQKLSLTNIHEGPKTSGMSMFEEDTRSSWSGEPPKATELKEDSLRPPDEDSLRPPDEDSLRPPDEDSLRPPDEEDSLRPPDEEDSLRPPDEEDSLRPPDEEDLLRPPDEEDSLRPPDEEDSLRPPDGEDSLRPPDEEDSLRPPDEEDSLRPPDEEDSLRPPDEEDLLRPPDEDSQLQKKKGDEVEEDPVSAFPPENLFEYMWPQEGSGGEFFILQEQICDYLNVKSFKRKYPDLVRRSVDMDERRFLKERGVVTEMQCDLGLTALRSEEVLELMSRDYPDQYREYIRILREKEQQSITEKRREYAATNSDKTKMVDLVKKAVQSAAEYNAHLNQERREERRSCMDLQTFTIHYPAKTQKIKVDTKPGKYPVALLPGQFQDYYKAYSSDELKYLPVNTVLYGPLKELQSVRATSDGSQSDSEDSTASDGSCCSSTHDDSSSSSEKNEKDSADKTAVETTYRPKVKPNATCKVCKKGPDSTCKELVHCSDCDNSAHPYCIELTMDVVDVLKTYPWQCMDCKVCSHCRDPNDEDKMLFCDVCDRGYHTFCVGLKTLPQGKWVCRRCGACSVCGASRPGPEATKAQWQYETEMDANRRPKIMCQSCFKKKR